MDKKLEHYCELMVDNRTIFSKTFWLSDYMNIASSVLYTSEEKIADKDNLKKTYKILRKNANLLSVFRANMESLMTAKISLTEDPLDYFMDIRKIYADLDPNKVFKSELVTTSKESKSLLNLNNLPFLSIKILLFIKSCA